MSAQSSEVVIIGGGIMGVSLAWQLAERGVAVTLFERATIASGASGRTGALLRQHYTNPHESLLAHHSLQTYRNWAEIVGGDCGFVQSGLVVTVDTTDEFAANRALLHRNVAMQRALGIDTQVVTAAELADIEPFANTDDLTAAVYEPSSGYVDSITATRTMAAAAIRAGAQIVEHQPVTEILVDGDRIHGVRTASGRTNAETVVCMTGPWSPTLLDRIGVAVPVTALRVQVAIVQQPLALTQPHASYVDTAAGIFCRPWGPGRTLVGVGGGDQHDAVDPDAYNPHNDPTYPAHAIAALARRLPVMAGASYLHGHAGLYDMTPDAHPIIGPAGPDGLYLALGFSGAGFKKGPAVGQALADAILDGHSPLVDLTPFHLSRFENEDWRHPWSDTEYALSSDFGHGF